MHQCHKKLLGPGRYWNDQSHAYHGSGCIPLSRQFHECYCGTSGLNSARSDFNAVGVSAAKSFSVLASIGTINHTRITGLVVFRYRARDNKVIETHLKNLDEVLLRQCREKLLASRFFALTQARARFCHECFRWD